LHEFCSYDILANHFVVAKLHEFCGYDILANHFGVAEDLNLMAIVTFMLATQTFCMTIYLAVMYPYTRINCKRSGSSEDTRSTNMFIIRLTPYDLTVLAVHQDISYVPQFPAIYQHTKFGTKIFNCSEDMGQSIMRI